MDEMTREEVDELVREVGFGVLALSAEGDAYALPLFYGRDEKRFYFHSRPGMKDDFIRGTKTACLLITRVESPDDWQSVQVFGTLERIGGSKARAAAAEVLLKVPLPPEWGLEPSGSPRRSARGSFVWALTPARIFGRKSQVARLAAGVETA